MIFIELKDDCSENVKYDYPDFPIYIRRALLSSYPTYSAPSHWHDDIELISVLSGEMQYNINGQISLLKKGEGVVVNARQLHFGFSETQKECDFICILIHPLLLCTTAAIERDFVLPVLHNREASFIHLKPSKIWQKSILSDIQSIYSAKDATASPLKILTAFTHMWTQIYENISHEQNNQTQNTYLVILKNMIGFVQKSYAEKITLADIAASGAVGQSKCCKLFSKYFRQTPNTYLNHYRLNKSAELLKNENMTVTEIAYAVGFNGSSYFSEAFRKWSGKSPTEYR